MIARVNKEHAERLCVDESSGDRPQQADDEVYLNNTLFTDAIRHSLSDLQQVTVEIVFVIEKCIKLFL